MLQLNLMVTRGLLPDRTFLVLLDADEAQRRGAAQPDRIEREGPGFMRRVDEAFRDAGVAAPGAHRRRRRRPSARADRGGGP